jgi:hypothetical protein
MPSRNTAFWNTVICTVIGDLRDMYDVAGFDVRNFHLISPCQHFVIFGSEVTVLLNRKYVCSRMCWVIIDQALG